MIELDEVEKEYRSGRGLLQGRVRALAGVSLRVPAGEALGVIGVNGAGKSTLLKLLLGYLRPSRGTALVGGMAPRRYAETRGVAYVPERVAIPPGWTVRGALTAYAMLGNTGEEVDALVDRALSRLGLTALNARRVGGLSKGNLQRLAIAQAIMADRDLMVLDEPTDGLDPLWIAELREIVGEWRAADPARTLVVASHNLPEVERIAERVIVLHDGVIREDFRTSNAQPGSLESRFLARAREWGEGS